MPLTTPVLHHRHRGSISGQNCLPERHQQRSFFSTTLSWWTTMDCVIRRDIVVARSGGFSEIVVARSGGFRDDWWIRMSLVFAQKTVLFGRACRVWDGCVEAEKDWWRASRIPGRRDTSTFLHSTQKEFLWFNLFWNIIEYRTVNRWNSLTEEVVSAPSLNSFKSRIDELWLGYSYVQNDCFPVHTNWLWIWHTAAVGHEYNCRPYQSRGQFRFCNSIPIPIPVISIPIQFRLRYKIPKAIQFQFRWWQFHSNSSQSRNTQTAFVPCYRHYIGIFFFKLIRVGLETWSFMDLNPSMQVHVLQPIKCLIYAGYSLHP